MKCIEVYQNYCVFMYQTTVCLSKLIIHSFIVGYFIESFHLRAFLIFIRLSIFIKVYCKTGIGTDLTLVSLVDRNL